MMGITPKTITLTLIMALMPFWSAKAYDKPPGNSEPQNKVEGLDLEKPSVSKTDNEAKQVPQPVNVNQANRYVLHFLAWIDEPYIAYRVIPDPYTGKVHTIPTIRYRRVLTPIYLDRLTNTYGYFDRFGNPVPYLPARYRFQLNPL